MNNLENSELDPEIDIVEDSDVFAALLQQEYIKSNKDFGENPRDKEVHDFIQYLSKNDECAVSVEIDGITKVHYPNSYKQEKNWDTPVLVIRDMETFVGKLEKLSNSFLKLRNEKRTYDYATESTNMVSVWFNATPNDFQNPEEFIDMYTQLLEGYKLQELKHGPSKKFESPTLHAELNARVNNENNTYETPFSFVPIVNFEQNGRTVKYELCKVRMGIYSEDNIDKAVIYAVQKTFDRKSQKEVLLTDLKREQAYIEEISKLFKDLYVKDNNDFITVFGEFPPEVFDEEDPTKFYKMFRSQLMQNMISKYGEAKGQELALVSAYLQDDYPQFTLEVGKNGGRYLDNIAMGIRRIRALNMDTTLDVKEITEEIEDIDGMEEKYKRIARALKTSAPPSHVAGLVMSLAMLESQGIKEVKVPLYLPLRVKDHENRLELDTSDELENRKLNNLIENLAYITVNIKGVEMWQDPGTTEDGASYLTLKLSTISSEREILQEFINAGKLVNVS